MIALQRYLLPLAAALLVLGCTKSNMLKPTALQSVKNNVTVAEVWRQSLSSRSDVRLQATASDDVVVAVSGRRTLVLLDRETGSQRWQVSVGQDISGSPSVGRSLVVVGTLEGELLAYDRNNGKPLWTAKLSSELFSAPVIKDDVIVTRTNDSRLTAFSAKDGAVKWVYQRQLPALMLRSFAAPVVNSGQVYFGLPGGRMLALSLQEGSVIWDVPVATPKGASDLDRMADVTGRVVADERQACASAYQGRVACFSASAGGMIWNRELSSWSGLAMDSRLVVAVDDQSVVHAYDRNTGREEWQQKQLLGRQLTGAALLGGRYAVVGDLDGYLHYLDLVDGSIAARQSIDGGPITMQPENLPGNRLLVQTQRGNLVVVGLK